MNEAGDIFLTKEENSKPNDVAYYQYSTTMKKQLFSSLLLLLLLLFPPTAAMPVRGNPSFNSRVPSGDAQLFYGTHGNSDVVGGAKAAAA